MRISGAEFERIIAVSDSTKSKQADAVIRQNPAQKADRADFSPQATEISDIKKLVDQIPDVREDRVKELSEKIASGTYKVSNEDIAEMMLRRNTADRVE